MKTFANKAAVAVAPLLTAQTILAQGDTVAGDQDGAFYQITGPQPTAPEDIILPNGNIAVFQMKYSPDQGGTVDPVNRYGTITVTAGAGGDYPGVDEALTALSNIGKKHDPGSSVIVSILSGTTIPSNIIIDSVDLSWITIQSVDATVPVTSAGLTGGKGFWVVRNGADSPTIDCIFVSDVSGAGGYAGLYAEGVGSTAGILPGKGFQSFTNSVKSDAGALIGAQSVTTIGSTGDAFAVIDGGIIDATGSTGTHSQAANVIYREGIIYHDSGPIFLPVVHHADAATAEAASIADAGVALHVSPGEHVDDEYTIGSNANGFYRIRNQDGYIEQWGSRPYISRGLTATYPFPVAFTATPVGFSASMGVGNGANTEIWTAGEPTDANDFQLTWGYDQFQDIFWMAKGY